MAPTKFIIMNIIQKVQKLSGGKREAPQAPKAQLNDAEVAYLRTRPSLAPEVLAEIKAFRETYPAVKEHVIHRVMKLHDFKTPVIHSELQFINGLQKPRKNNPAATDFVEKEQQAEEEGEEEEEGAQQVAPKPESKKEKPLSKKQQQPSKSKPAAVPKSESESGPVPKLQSAG